MDDTIINEEELFNELVKLQLRLRNSSLKVEINAISYSEKPLYFAFRTFMPEGDYNGKESK